MTDKFPTPNDVIEHPLLDEQRKRIAAWIRGDRFSGPKWFNPGYGIMGGCSVPILPRETVKTLREWYGAGNASALDLFEEAKYPRGAKVNNDASETVNITDPQLADARSRLIKALHKSQLLLLEYTTTSFGKEYAQTLIAELNTRGWICEKISREYYHIYPVGKIIQTEEPAGLIDWERNKMQEFAAFLGNSRERNKLQEFVASLGTRHGKLFFLFALPMLASFASIMYLILYDLMHTH